MSSHADGSERTLALIDEALASGAITAADERDRELQELALALAADAPEPDDRFAAEMDARLAAGFPRRPTGVAGRALAAVHAGRDRLAALAPRRLTPRVAATAASLVLALAVAAGLISRATEAPEPDTPAVLEQSDRSEPSPAGGESSRELGAIPPEGAEPARDGEPLIAPAPAPPGAGSPREELGERDRRVEQSALMTLAAPAQRLDEAAAGIAQTTRRHGGFVLSSTLTTGDRGAAGGQFELRIPMARLDAALADLGELGEVRRLTRDEQDVTGSFATVEDRIRALRAERRGLLERLESATDDDEAAQLRTRLRALERKLGRSEALQRRLERRVSFAAVSVTLERGRDDAGGAVGQALDDAVEILAGGLGIAIRGAAVLLPLAIVGLLAWLAAGALRRRRREAILR